MRLFCTFCTSWHCQPRRHGHSCSGVVTAWRFSAGGALYPRTSVVVGTGYPRTGPDGKRQLDATPRPSRPSIASSTRQSSRQDKRGEPIPTPRRCRPPVSKRCGRAGVELPWTTAARRDSGDKAVRRIIVWLPQQPRATRTKKHGAVLLLLLPTVMLGREKGRLEIKRGELDGDAVRSCRNSRYSVGGLLFSLDEGS